MSMYIIFFGKSQDFTIRYYDRNNHIEDFSEIIKDFDLLESNVFTVDDIKNKEILSRYFFNAQGKKYCLLKLYSFAQALSGSRIAGSIYGVGLLSDCNIKITKDNLALLRAAKDNFTKLSLNGLKFNKSNFEADTDRIWKAIINSKDGNLLDKVTTSNPKFNGTNDQVAFFVNELFAAAAKLDERVANQDIVYFSEDLEHLKRTQNKWGSNVFPIYWEQNNQYLIYKEPTPPPKEPIQQKSSPKNNQQTETQITNQKLSSEDKIVESGEIASIKSELLEIQTINQFLQEKAEKLIQKNKLYKFLVYSLVTIILLFIVYFFFFPKEEPVEVEKGHPPVADTIFIERSNSIEYFINDRSNLNDGIDFLNGVQYIYSYNAKLQLTDSVKLHNQFKKIESLANKHNISIDSIKVRYDFKCKSLTESKKINVSIKIEDDSLKTKKSPR